MFQLPQTCYYCEEEITERGRRSGSLTIHSLDGCHENYAEDNKVPTHKRCHIKYHSSKGSVKVTNKRVVIVTPVSLRDKLKGMKRYRKEPLWEVIERLLGGELQ